MYVDLKRTMRKQQCFVCVRLCMTSDLSDTAEAPRPPLTGADHQQISPLVALVVQRPGQAHLSRLSLHGEQTAGVDQQAVADWLLLEGNGQHYQEAAGGDVWLVKNV